MRRVLAAEITILAVVAAGALVMAAGSTDPASADDSRCVTRPEHRRVKVGMTKQRVERIFDLPGYKSPWFRNTYYYRWCTKAQKYTQIRYTARMRVRSKAVLTLA